MTAPVNRPPASPAKTSAGPIQAMPVPFPVGLLRDALRQGADTADQAEPTVLPRSRLRSDLAPRRWTINGDFLGLKATGIARYAREITLALDALMAERHPLTQGLTLNLVTPRQPVEPLELRHIALSTLPELRPRLPQVWVQWQLPRRVPDGLLSFCNLAPVRARKHIVCIHDLQTRTTPQSYGRLFRALHRLILPRLAHCADIVTTVSASSKSTFLDFGLASPDKIVVVPNGSDHALRWDPRKADRGWRHDRPFVLCIGRNEAHKNMALIWAVAPHLHLHGIDVVVAGDFDCGPLDKAAGGRPANLRCVGRVSDHELASGFSEALCFLFPSRTEGFGLPAVEAMAWGCPVVASRNSCLMEICGGAALFADPDDAEEWAEAIRRLSEAPRLAETLRCAGRIRACHYVWRDAAETYLRLMLDVDQRHAAAAEPRP